MSEEKAPIQTAEHSANYEEMVLIGINELKQKNERIKALEAERNLSEDQATIEARCSERQLYRAKELEEQLSHAQKRIEGLRELLNEQDAVVNRLTGENNQLKAENNKFREAHNSHVTKCDCG